MNELVNLIVTLDGERFGADAFAAARRGIEAAGGALDDVGAEDERLLAWIDDEFGGGWSSAAFVGRSVVAVKDREIAGFAAYDPRGLRFDWLRGFGAQPDVGIFGPFGVGRAFRKFGIGPPLLVAALARLRERGYARALVPAVGEEKLVAYYREHAGATVAESFPKSRWHERRVRATILASGSGTNAQAVIDGARDGRLPLEIASVVCNVPSAFVVERARAAGVSARVVAWNRDEESRTQYDVRLCEAMRGDEPELLLLLGWMHLLDSEFVRAFPEAINIHPAFLPLDQARDTVTLPDGSVQPAFRGPRALRDALRADASWVGATAHRLSLETDRGTVLVRKPLRVGAQRDEASVLEALHPIEHRVVASAIVRWVYER